MDYIGPHFGFEDNNSLRFKTFQGAVFSFITFAVAVVIGVLFGREVYERKSPNVSVSSEYLDTSRVYLQDYPMIYSFYYPSILSLENIEKYFDFNIQRIEITPTQQYMVYSNYTLVNCKEQLPKFTTYQDTIGPLLQLSSTNFHCINFTEWDYTQNKFGSGGNTFWQVEVYLCDPTDPTRDCWVSEQFKQLSSITLGHTFVNLYLDTLNYDKPIVPYLESIVIQLSYDFVKMENFFITNDVLVSDDGWLLEAIREINYSKYNGYILDFNKSTIRDNKQMLYSNIFSSPQIRSKISRNYMKIQELFAKIGGVANALLIIITILTQNYLRYKYLHFVRENSYKSRGDDSNPVFKKLDIGGLLISNKLINKLEEVKEIEKVEAVNEQREGEKDLIRNFDTNNKSNILNNSNDTFQLKFKQPQMLSLNLNNRPEPSRSKQNIPVIKDTLFGEKQNIEGLSSNQIIPHNNIASGKSKNVSVKKIPELMKSNSCNNDIFSMYNSLFYKEKNSVPQSISYFGYVQYLICWICMKEEKKLYYKQEVTRIKALLNVRLFHNYLINSYSMVQHVNDNSKL